MKTTKAKRDGGTKARSHERKGFGVGAACVVCGCTETRPCEDELAGNCSWVMSYPPLCSACVNPYLFAKLWGVVMALEGKAVGPTAKLVREVRVLWELAGTRLAVFNVPTLRKICAINRRAKKLNEVSP